MTEPEFIAKKGQVDYTNIRYCPVVNSVVCRGDKILLVKRSSDLRLYPGYWNGISGFLDTDQSLEEKVEEEIEQELGLKKSAIKQMRRGHVFSQDAAEYHKTWIVFPVAVEVSSDRIKLDWEASDYIWTSLDKVKQMELMPGFLDVIEELFG